MHPEPVQRAKVSRRLSCMGSDALELPQARAEGLGNARIEAALEPAKHACT